MRLQLPPPSPPMDTLDRLLNSQGLLSGDGRRGTVGSKHTNPLTDVVDLKSSTRNLVDQLAQLQRAIEQLERGAHTVASCLSSLL